MKIISAEKYAELATEVSTKKAILETIDENLSMDRNSMLKSVMTKTRGSVNPKEVLEILDYLYGETSED